MIINPGDKLKGFIFKFVLICSSSSAQYGWTFFWCHKLNPLQDNFF